jgi:chaperone required for assembly of F1-ATPase
LKRFWKTAGIAAEDGGWGVRLDGRALRTPARALLVVPTRALAAAIAGEWDAVEETVDPRAMPMTGLANAAVDRVAADPHAFARGLALYGESDLTCYRADGPSELVRRQCESWDKLLGWARRRYDVDFATATGVIHVSQPEATVQRLAHAVTTLDAFHLAALSPLVTIGGSLVAGLAVVEGAVSVADAWNYVSIDERWQLEQWGSDSEAELALENRRSEFFAAARFLELIDQV